MKTYRISTIPGDGIGKEVVPAGREVLQRLAAAMPSLRLEFEDFGWGGDDYRRHGAMMPADGLDLLRGKDAILFGSAGDPDIADHITLWGLRLAICQGFDQYDVYNVTVTLESYGKKLSTFVFQQYKDFDSFVEINDFSVTPKKSHLLDIKKCFFEKSNEQETIDQRCDIAIRFVFQKTFFTGLSIVINDRAGSAPAEAYIYYNSEESVRSGNTLVIPWIGVQITLSLPPYLLDIIAIILATLGVMYYLKKTGIREKRKKTFQKIS